MTGPDTHYARSGDVNIAYQVLGKGPPDLIFVGGYISHLEMAWESPQHTHMMERLASFSRVVIFDKRGVGLSDPVDALPPLEQRMEDVRCVMDAVGSEEAVLFGVSEGGMMCMLFAATWPERTRALVLYGAMARSVEAPDYPFAAPRDALVKSAELLGSHWGEGVSAEMFAPSISDDPGARQFVGRLERYAASPRAAWKLHEMFLDMDVRHVLPAIRVPTLVMHRRGDRVVNVRAGRWLAEQIQGARYVELEGIDHSWLAGDVDALLDETEEFVTGARTPAEPDRVLATVMFTDIVGSTERAAALGDAAWRDLLAHHNAITRRELERFRGTEVKTLGDGFMATFDGPARGMRCGAAIAAACAAAGVPVRVGLHTGEVELIAAGGRGTTADGGGTAADVGGIAVHIAARVAALAGPGEVMVSRTVRDLVAGSGIGFTDHGTHRLKGVPDEWQLYTVVG